MKRLLFTLTLTASQLVAAPGFYTGGAIGGHLAQASASGSVAGTVRSLYYPFDLQKNFFDEGVTGILYAGYGFRWHSFDLAAEGVLQLGYAQFSNERLFNALLLSANRAAITTVNVDADINCFQGGIDFLPGWSPNNSTQLYGRIGIGAAKASLHLSSTNLGQFFSLGSLELSSSDNRTFATLRAGAGLEQRIGTRLSLRSDYIFTDYGRLSFSDFVSGTTPLGNAPISLRNEGRFHFYDHAILLGLSYRLCLQEPICCDPCFITQAYQGSYLGGVVGGSILSCNQHGQIVSEVPSLNSLFQSITMPLQLYHNQFQGMLFLGYGASRKWAYLGGEIIIAAATHKKLDFVEQAYSDDTTSDTLYSTSFDTALEPSTWQYGFDLRPGVLLMPRTLIYGRVGVSAAEIEASSSARFTGDTGTDITWTSPNLVSVSHWKPAFRLGIGAEQALNSKLHLRADYVFTNYGVIAFNSRATGINSEGNPTFLTNTLTGHLQNNALFLGLTYYFH